jgi:5,10-methylenetetrahydromethanopterin reductase
MTKLIGIGVWPGAELSAPEAVDVTVQADLAGFHSVWFSEAYYARDAVSVMAASAVKTSNIKLATGVVNPYTRHPALLAMTVATLNELAPGRVIYGLGASERPWIENMGYSFARPKTAVSEALDVYEQLLARQAVEFEGKETTLRDARLMFSPIQPAPEIVLAAVGPRMSAMARDRASGVLLPVGSPSLAKTMVERVASESADFIVGMTVPLSVHDDLQTAVSRVRGTVVGLLVVPEGEAMLEMSGHDPALAESLRQAIATDGFRAALDTLPLEVVQDLAIVGTHEACIEGIRSFIDAGVNLPILQVGRHGQSEAFKALQEAQGWAG